MKHLFSRSARHDARYKAAYLRDLQRGAAEMSAEGAQARVALAALAASMALALDSTNPGFSRKFEARLELANDHLNGMQFRHAKAIEALEWTRNFIQDMRAIQQHRDDARLHERLLSDALRRSAEAVREIRARAEEEAARTQQPN
jgi:hypothetical protein